MGAIYLSLFWSFACWKFLQFSPCCHHSSSFGFITLAYYPRWDPWAERNRKKRRQRAPLGVGEEVKSNKERWDIKWIMLQRRDDPSHLLFLQSFSLTSLRYFILLWLEEAAKQCVKTTLQFIFLLCPSAGHTYSFNTSQQCLRLYACLCLYACVCTCAPTAASSWVRRCIICIHQPN